MPKHLRTTAALFTIMAATVSPIISHAATSSTQSTRSTFTTRIQLNGSTLSKPQAFVANGTTYVPIYYVGQLLQTLGIHNEWAGSGSRETWTLTTSGSSSSSTTSSTSGSSGSSTSNSTSSSTSSSTANSTGALDLHIKAKSGSVNIIVNGQTVEENIDRIVATDPSSGKPTTFIPIWYVQQLLSALQINNHWDGQPGVKKWTVSSAQSASWKDAIVEGSASVSNGTSKETVTYVRINTKDPHVSVHPVIANNQFGTTATLATLADSSNAIAAINGTFFNSYSDKMPQGTLMVNGTFEHLSSAPILTIANDGAVSMERGKKPLLIGINGQWTWPNVVWASGLNSWRGNPDEIEVLTPFYGAQSNVSAGVAVVVQHGIVTDIVQGNTDIPQDGYVIQFGSSSATYASKFQVGDKVDYKVELKSSDGNTTYDLSNVVSAIGSAPMLVDQGQNIVDSQLDGMSQKLVNSVSSRSLVGIDSNGYLVFATVPGANLHELAQIAVNMHLVEAMNLDGGASSGLIFNGKYIVKPGRQLADALVVGYNP